MGPSGFFGWGSLYKRKRMNLGKKWCLMSVHAAIVEKSQALCLSILAKHTGVKRRRVLTAILLIFRKLVTFDLQNRGCSRSYYN